MPTPTVTEYRKTGSDGGDRAESCEAPPRSTVVNGVGLHGQIRPFSHMAHRTNFAELPAASVAAASDKYLITVGTGTEVVARSTVALGSGATITTQATTPLAADNALLVAVTAGGMRQAVSTLTGLRWSTRLSLDDVSLTVGSFGLSELLTDADPTGTAGEGVLFLCDPSAAVTTGLTAAQHLNWILAYKVNGVDTFAATSVVLEDGKAYDLDIVGTAGVLTFKCYINGVLVGTSPALTSGDVVCSFHGIEATSDVQRYMAVRLVEFGPTYVQ